MSTHLKLDANIGSSCKCHHLMPTKLLAFVIVIIFILLITIFWYTAQFRTYTGTVL